MTSTSGTPTGRIDWGIIEYRCGHKFDSKNDKVAFRARVPKEWHKSIPGVRGLAEVRLEDSDCLMCELVNELYWKTDRMLNTPLNALYPYPREDIEIIQRTLHSIIDEAKGQTEFQYDQETFKTVQNMHKIIEANLVISTDFFTKWEVVGISGWRGTRGQYPIVKFAFPRTQGEKALLCQLMWEKGLKNTIPFALEDPGSDDELEEWKNPKPEAESDQFYREWKAEKLKEEYARPTP